MLFSLAWHLYRPLWLLFAEEMISSPLLWPQSWN